MSVYVQLQTVFEYGLLFAMSKRRSKDLSETTPSPKKKKRSEVSTIGVLVDTRPLFLTGFHCRFMLGLSDHKCWPNRPT